MTANQGGDSAWTTDMPVVWPEAPTDMSYSALAEIEACPRRWSLSMAPYPHLWEQRGYPPRLSVSGLGGTVIHLALATIVSGLARAGCRSILDPAAVGVTKSMGGYTAIIDECVQRVLHRHQGNPRAVPLIESAARTLRQRRSDLRTKLQYLLGRLMLQSDRAEWARSPTHRERSRAPLGPGNYTELEVRVPTMGWKGTIDLLVLSDAHCEIVDFKTGTPEDTHALQLFVYALLWTNDAQLNPSARMPDKLTLAYPSRSVSIPPPSVADLKVLEHDLVERRRAATAAIDARPPLARPAPANCRYCSVRQLCDDYWTVPTSPALLPHEHRGTAFRDLEMSVVARHGPSSWDGHVLVCSGINSGHRVVLRTTSPLTRFVPGDVIRVLDAHLSTDPDDGAQPVVATMSSLSEVYRVPRSQPTSAPV